MHSKHMYSAGRSREEDKEEEASNDDKEEEEDDDDNGDESGEDEAQEQAEGSWKRRKRHADALPRGSGARWEAMLRAVRLFVVQEGRRPLYGRSSTGRRRAAAVHLGGHAASQAQRPQPVAGAPACAGEGARLDVVRPVWRGRPRVCGRGGGSRALVEAAQAGRR